MKKIGVTFGGLVGLGAIIVACSSSSGGATSGGSPEAGTCGGLATVDPQCNTCLMSSCCSEGTKCQANSACEAIYQCVQACNTDACSQACLTSNPNGTTDFNTLTGCLANNCSAACTGGTTGGDGGGMCGGIMFTDTACQSCFASSCCSQGTACSADADCNALNACIGGCAPNDAACANSCAAAHTKGNELLSALGNCLSGPCGTACGISGGDSGSQCGFGSTDACVNTCLNTTCCSQGSQCAQSGACLALFDCVASCASTDLTCVQACATANQGGVAAFNALTTCESSCPCGTDGGGDSGSADGG